MNDHIIALSGQATTIGFSSGISSPYPLAPRFLGAVVTLLIMLALKRHYSLATAAQLDWILAPTAKLVAWLTPAHPVYEYGVGYVDFVAGIIVAPACAGVNFMIMAFGLAALWGVVNIRRTPILIAWLPAALGAAYVYTLMVNTIRIGISMVLYRANIYGGWLTMERLHRLAGIALYLTALWLFFIGIQAIASYDWGRSNQHTLKKRGALSAWLPPLWYLLGAVGVPLANSAFQQQPPAWGEHCLTITVASTCFGGLLTLMRRLIRCQNQLN